MGRVFSIDFEDSEYCMCKNCRTHIALPVIPGSTRLPGGTIGRFITFFNVEVDHGRRELFWSDIAHTVSDVYCIKCGDNLGFKYIHSISDGKVRVNDILQLEMRKLLWRQGDEIRDALTLIIIE